MTDTRDLCVRLRAYFGPDDTEEDHRTIRALMLEAAAALDACGRIERKSTDVTIRCPGCHTQLTCAAYSWITPTVVGRWLIPDHPAHLIGDYTLAVVQPEGTIRVDVRCAYSGARVERTPRHEPKTTTPTPEGAGVNDPDASRASRDC